MAKSTKKTASKKPSQKSTSSTKVTRITASDDGAKKSSSRSETTKVHKLTSKEKVAIAENKNLKSPSKKVSKSEIAAQKSEKQSGRSRRPLRAIGQYFRGAWYELRQVRWPDRSNTWQMTGALLVFTLFIAIVILLLDALFKYLFQLMIGQ